MAEPIRTSWTVSDSVALNVPVYATGGGGGEYYLYRLPPSREELDRLAADERRYLEARRERQEKRKAAEKKAEMLFLSCLTDQQRKQLDTDNSFKVIGSGKKNRYIISCSSTVENVWRTRYGKPRIMYCAAPRGTSISWDIWLAQKLILESDEPAFLKVAVASMFDYASMFD